MLKDRSHISSWNWVANSKKVTVVNLHAGVAMTLK